MMIHSLHMPGEKSGSAVVLPINTKKLGGYFKFLKMVNLLKEMKSVTKYFFFFCLATVPKFFQKKIISPGSLLGQEI